MNLKVSSVLKSEQKITSRFGLKIARVGHELIMHVTHTFLDEVHEAKLRNKESEQSLDQIFNEVATA